MNARVVRLLQRSSDRLQKNQKQQLYQQQQHSDGGDSGGSSDSEPPKAPRRKRRDCAAGVKAKLETESNNALACLRALSPSLPLCCALSFSLSCALPLALSHFNVFCAFRCLLSFAQAASASVSVATLRVSYAACVAVHVGSAACGSVVNFRFSIKATAAPPTAQSALCLL